MLGSELIQYTPTIASSTAVSGSRQPRCLYPPELCKWDLFPTKISQLSGSSNYSDSHPQLRLRLWNPNIYRSGQCRSQSTQLPVPAPTHAPCLGHGLQSPQKNSAPQIRNTSHTIQPRNTVAQCDNTTLGNRRTELRPRCRK